MLSKLFLLLTNCFIIILLFNACGEGKVEEANDFLTMDCGYNYIHHVQNAGAKPQIGEVAYYYFITRADDSLMMDGRAAEMVSKMQIPKPLPNPREVASPILEAIKLMSIGDSVTVVVPLDSVPQMPPGFEKFTNFYYDLVLIDIKSKEENIKLVEEERNRNNAHAKEIHDFSIQILEDYRSGKLDDNIVEKPSGLKYYIVEEGTGSIPIKGETVHLRYHAMLSEGQVFDSSFTNSPTFPVKVGAGTVVAGWDEALTYLKRGTKAMLFVPSDLGYGDEGNPSLIPPKAELIYYIELVK